MNALLALAVGGAAVGIVNAATSRDPARVPGLAAATKPRPTVTALAAPTTLSPIGLHAAGAAMPPADVAGEPSTSTSTSTSTPATTATTSPGGSGPAPPAPPAEGSQGPTSPAPVTTVPNPGVVFSEATDILSSSPLATTTIAPPTTIISAPPSTATTVPPPTTTVPPATTAPPATTTTVAPLLPGILGLPPLLPAP